MPNCLPVGLASTTNRRKFLSFVRVLLNPLNKPAITFNLMQIPDVGVAQKLDLHGSRMSDLRAAIICICELTEKV